MLTYGEMFAGYGGLGMGVQSVLGGEMAWCAEFDAAPSRILGHHWPDVPNLGDVTKVNWATVPKVDVITGGSPCQDLSHAGKRAGMTTGTRSNLWVEMREAIATIRPRLVVWENVRGAGSAEADSALEQCPRCVGDPRERGPVLRALGRVLGDLSDLGYDAWWTGFPASDIGACHGRFRYFVFATPADAVGGGLHGWTPESQRVALGGAVAAGGGQDAGGPVGLTLLPTPAVNDMGKAYTPETWDVWTAEMQAKHGNGNGHGKSLSIEAQRLLPTPQAHDSVTGKTAEQVAAMRQRTGAGVSNLNEVAANELAPRLFKTPTSQLAVNGGSQHPDKRKEATMDAHASGGGYNGQVNVTLTDAAARQGLPHVPQWGEYEVGIRRQEALSGRPAPLPTEPGPKGGARLSPRFVEWMMWLPEGHVTDPAIWDGMTDAKGRALQGDRLASAARNAQLKALGNGVVTAQAAAATRWWLAQLHATKAVA